MPHLGWLLQEQGKEAKGSPQLGTAMETGARRDCRVLSGSVGAANGEADQDSGQDLGCNGLGSEGKMGHRGRDRGPESGSL